MQSIAQHFHDPGSTNMTKHKVAITRYEKPVESLRSAIDISQGLAGVPVQSRVFIKPNIVLWSDVKPFPKWGLITTSRMIEDTVTILSELGFNDITIGEGPVLLDPRDKDIAIQAFENLGYTYLEKRFGVKLVNVHRETFVETDLGDDVRLNFNRQFIESDFIVNIPVMKTHSQTVVSLGIKNLKGVIDINSRKACHSSNESNDLHYMVSRLVNALPESLTILDGIYTNECGPGFDGKMRRSDLIVASRDVFAADKVGAALLGFSPSDVPYLVHAAEGFDRPVDFSDLEVHGGSIDDFHLNLRHEFEYDYEKKLPMFMSKKGIDGLSVPKPDSTLCTYCFTLTGLILGSIMKAWNGAPWDKVELLTGKIMKPTPGMNKTILLGKCMCKLNADHPDIRQVVPVNSCPPSKNAIIDALVRAGIPIDPDMIQHPQNAPSLLYRKYSGNPEFDESFFRIVPN
jgi:uncharacterized protein (DUF362 family)